MRLFSPRVVRPCCCSVGCASGLSRVYSRSLTIAFMSPGPGMPCVSGRLVEPIVCFSPPCPSSPRHTVFDMEFKGDSYLILCATVRRWAACRATLSLCFYYFIFLRYCFYFVFPQHCIVVFPGAARSKSWLCEAERCSARRQDCDVVVRFSSGYWLESRPVPTHSNADIAQDYLLLFFPADFEGEEEGGRTCPWGP